MKNTIVVDMRDNCNCTCIESTAEDENTINVVFYTGDVEWAEITIYTDDVFRETIAGIETGSINYLTVPDEYIPEGEGNLRLIFSDSTNVWDPFVFSFPEKHIGNMTVAKKANFQYVVSYKAPEPEDLADQVQENTEDIESIWNELENGLKVESVLELPEKPDFNTIYLIQGEVTVN